MTTLEDKRSWLNELLRLHGSALVAFSGGVDSTLVLKVAHDVLGARALAVTGRSPSVPEWELEEAQSLARAFGVRHLIVDTEELDDANYRANAPNRCYFCKSELFSKLEEIREREGLAVIVDGTNRDDLGDHRPGMKARAERNILSPLVETGFTKADVRELSRELDLSTAEKPAFACLASRFPYGTEVTGAGLARVEAAERVVRDAGFRQFRVRHHGDIARLEIDPDEIHRALDPGTKSVLVEGVRAAGYGFVTIDLEGYRSGRMNESLPRVDAAAADR